MATRDKAVARVKPHVPPGTAREVLHLFLGDTHAEHTVARAESTKSGIALVCSCGKVRLIDAKATHKAGVVKGEVEHGLRNVLRI